MNECNEFGMLEEKESEFHKASLRFPLSTLAELANQC